jgi:hypothetical protein
VEGGLVVGESFELGVDNEGDRMGWLCGLTGQEAVVWEDESRAGGKAAEGAAALCMGHPG